MPSPNLSAGVDLVRSSESLLIFDAAHPYHVVPLPESDGGRISDVFLSLRGERSPYFTMNGVPFFFPHDVHIYYCQGQRTLQSAIDLTSIYRLNALAGLRQINSTDVRLGYSDGLESTVSIEAAGALGIVVDQGHVTADRLAIPSVVASDFSTYLAKLGDRSLGVGGSLHAFNYLHTFIPLGPISLAALLNSLPASPSGTDLASATRPRIILSHGRLEDLAKSQYPPAGAVRLMLEAVFHNPLEDEFDELERRIRMSLLELQKKLRANSALVLAIARIEDNSAHTRQYIENLETLVASIRLELSTLSREVADVAQRTGAQGSPSDAGSISTFLRQLFPR